MNCELIAVGTELLLGEIANTDAQMISQGLTELGINVFHHTVVGDNPQRLKQVIEIAKGRADIIITTGGLGPTADDLTKETIAAAFGKKLVLDEGSMQRLRRHFDAYHGALLHQRREHGTDGFHRRGAFAHGDALRPHPPRRSARLRRQGGSHVGGQPFA